MPGEPFHELISTHQQVFFPFCTVTVVTQTDFILTGIMLQPTHRHRWLFQVRAEVHRHMCGVIHHPGYVDIPAAAVMRVQEAIPVPFAVSFHCQFIDRNLNPQKTKKAPQNGCFFNTPCAPYERKRLLNRMTLIDTGYEWRFFAPFPVKWTQLPLCGSQPHTCCRASRSCIRTSSASR
nr:hypothetical protein CELPGHNA_00005 [Escherichia coli]